MAVESIGATVYSLIASCNNYFNVVNADAPVAWYRHTTGSLGVDDSGNANDATTTTDVTAVAGLNACVESAGSYNGTTSYQLVPPDTTIDNLGFVSVTQGKQFTIELLIYLTAYPSTTRDVFISKCRDNTAGANGNGGWMASITSAGEVYFFANTTGATALRVHTTTTLSLNTWHHIVIIGEGGTAAGICAFYVDGILEDANSGMVIDSIGAAAIHSDVANYLKLGCSEDETGTLPSNLFDFINARIDELCLYNKKLSSGKILVHSLALGFNYPNTYTAAVLQALPVAYYRHEGDSINGIVGDDWTSHANDAAITGTIGSVNGTIGDAANYTTTQNLIVTNVAGTNQDLAFGSAIFTVEVILKVTSLAAARVICAKGNAGAGGHGWHILVQTDGSLQVSVRYPSVQGIFESPAGTVTTATWYHLVFVCQGDSTSATGIRKIYKNNVSQTITHVSDPSGVQLSDSAYPLVIGQRRNSANSAYELGFNGDMDDLAIYNRELSASEVAAHFALTGL